MQEFVVRLNLLVPGCSIYRNLSLFLSSTDKASFRITRAISFLNVRFRYGNAMQEVGNQVVSDDEKNFYLMLNL